MFLHLQEVWEYFGLITTNRVLSAGRYYQDGRQYSSPILTSLDINIDNVQYCAFTLVESIKLRHFHNGQFISKHGLPSNKIFGYN